MSETQGKVETEEGSNVGGKAGASCNVYSLSCSCGVKLSCRFLTVVPINLTRMADLKDKK